VSDSRSAANGPVRFGVFELDPSAGELRKHGIRIKLQDQPLHVLQLLLERPGQIVTREELQRRLWLSDTFVEFDKGIYNAIKRLRETLSDDADTPRYIETIARHGYRFIGSVEELGSEAPAPPAVISGDSIVVLPFTSMSTDPEDQFFSDGITEEIINALAQIEDLHVVARSSAFSFKGKHIDSRIVGEQLKVRTVLEGSVRRADNRLRITVQLVNSADGYHLWSERYDREMKDVFEIQDEIARSVAERLKITLESGRQQPLVKAGTKNIEAYSLYAKGRVLLARRGPEVPYVDCFERAVRLDPNYAQAWAGLADSYTVLGYSGLVRPQACMPRAMEAARRAVALDPLLAEAHNALAMACLMGTWDRVEAEREFLRSLELNPRYIQARDWYALFYLQYSEGRLDEGVVQAKRALESDPLSGYSHAVYGLTCAFARKYAEAVQASRRAVQLDSGSYLARMILQEVLHFSGRLEESVAAGHLALAMSGRHPWSMALLALTFAELGKASDAGALYEEMLARGRHQYLSPAMLACAAAVASREDEVTRHTRDAFEIRDPHCQFMFSRHVPYSLWTYKYPRFREIIAGMGRTDWLRD
jgi:TolB-like protein/Flp pilus assembly protein TadD